MWPVYHFVGPFTTLSEVTKILTRAEIQGSKSRLSGLDTNNAIYSTRFRALEPF